MKLKNRFPGKLLPIGKSKSSSSPHDKFIGATSNNKFIIGLLLLWALVMLFGVARCQERFRPLKVGDSI
ncbi:MAG: hypothetical protein JST19_10725, partial [Bacteroidetes bacterium]|nr:hypothetical protein [Bacteroidota bacterium]